jgi:hypothetical protein
MLAAAVGVTLASANLLVIRRLATKAVAQAATGDGAAAVGGLVARLGVKMVLLVALTWVVLGSFKLATMPFVLGIFALVAALLLAGFYTNFSEET